MTEHAITAELRRRIFAAVERERDYQDRKWGDSGHTVGEWVLILKKEVDEAIEGWAEHPGDDKALEEILQVVAVGVACLEQHGIVERKEPAP